MRNWINSKLVKLCIMYRMIEFTLYNYKSNYAEPFCVRVSVHVRESERERQREGDRGRKRVRERERGRERKIDTSCICEWMSHQHKTSTQDCVPSDSNLWTWNISCDDNDKRMECSRIISPCPSRYYSFKSLHSECSEPKHYVFHQRPLNPHAPTTQDIQQHTGRALIGCWWFDGFFGDAVRLQCWSSV